MKKKHLMLAALFAAGSMSLTAAASGPVTVNFDNSNPSIHVSPGDDFDDQNGPFNAGLQPNGIPDGDELFVLSTILADVNALNHNTIHTAYSANLTRMNTDLGALAGIAGTYLAGMITLGDDDTFGALAAFVSTYGVTLNPANYNLSGASTLAHYADADNDGLTNKQEYDLIPGLGGAGSAKRTAYVAAILGGASPEGEGAAEGEGTEEGEGEEVGCGLSECPPFAAQGTALVAQLVALTILPPGLTYQNANFDQPLGGTIPDRFEVALAQAVICGSGSLSDAARCTFNANLAALADETGYPLFAAADDFVAILLSISSEMQIALGGIGLSGDYSVIGAAGKAIGEPLSPQGDADGDGISNAQEYANVIADGGTEEDYIAAALNPLLDGTAASAAALPVGGVAALGGLLSLLGAAGAVVLRRKK